jgi:hypothetical protein
MGVVTFFDREGRTASPTMYVNHDGLRHFLLLSSFALIVALSCIYVKHFAGRVASGENPPQP